MAFKLFPRVRRLPTLVGILILVVGIATTTYLTQQFQPFFLKAGPGASPQSLKISNLGRNSFTASWSTPDDPSSGYLKYGKSPSLGKISLDERDQNINALGKYLVHSVTVTGLEPQTTYYFRIISQGKEYDQDGNPYTVMTASNGANPSSLSPTYGIILENNQPAKEGIVYVKVGNSSLLSALIKPSGNWLIPLTSLINQDLKSPFNPSSGDTEEIVVQGQQKTSKALTTLENNAPVPAITLGQDYDFRANPSSTPATVSATPATLAPNFDLLQPSSGAAIPGQPLFRGTGIPGQTVQITVESETPINGNATVDQLGNWTWQAPTNLQAGEHKVTVTATDNQGNSQTIGRNFIVLASGTQVVEAATPSATPKPTSSPTPTSTSLVLLPTTTPQLSPTSRPTATPTPTITTTPTPKPTTTPTPVLTLSPTPKATSAALPESGDLLLTLILTAGGVTFTALGLFFLKTSDLKLKNDSLKH